VALKPESVTFEQAASVAVAGSTALQGLRDQGKLRSGQRVLINGASGGVGTFAVQIARSFKAHVTGVCSTANLDLVRSLGAEEVIDYTRQDFTRMTARYDLILDNVSNHSAAACRRLLNSDGVCVIVGAPKGFGPMLRFLLTSVVAAMVLTRFGSRRLAAFIARIDEDDLKALAELMSSGSVTPVIDRRYALSEAREAMRYAEEGHARGKVVLTP
jgi:NADPH:quinone reductase-like Zn-dependent oxidoreductase